MKRQHHELKIAPEHFAGVIDGSKKAEFRVNDRNFQCADVMRLREWERDGYTGREVSVVVTDCTDVTQYIMRGHDDMTPDNLGYVMLSFDIIHGSICKARYLR